MRYVIVHPKANLIIVDGNNLSFKFSIPENLPQNLTMLHWKDPNLDGSMYRTENDGENVPLDETEENYNLWVKPFVDQWEAEKARLAPTAEEIKAEALATIDNATSAAILAGFDYEVEGESLHFSYDSFDQQNFADTANVAMMNLNGIEGLPTSVTWNAYRNYTAETGGELVRLTLEPSSFLALYTGGALVHKATQMEIGGQRKAQVEACESVDEIKALLAEWGL